MGRDNGPSEEGALGIRLSGCMSRRQFLKTAAVAGALVGTGTGLGGLLAACGSEKTPSTTGATTGTGATGDSSSQTTTTASSAGAEQGRPVRVGVVCPKTGQYATFATSMDYNVSRWNEAVAGGVILGDGKNHTFDLRVVDSQSDTNRASQVTGDLIQNDKVDVMLSFGSPDTVNPVADQCEAQNTPSLSLYSPWEPFYFQRGGTPDKPFKWTFDANAGVGDFMAAELDLFSQIETNKVVGLLFPNTANGQAYMDEKAGWPPLLEKAGYTVVFPGLYPPQAEDYTKEVSEFKKAGCELAVGSPAAADLTNFWKQCLQQSFRPKIVEMGMGCLFPEDIGAIGPSAQNFCTNCSWHPSFPYKSTLTGETCQQMADDYEEKTGKQWSMPLGTYSLFEWAVDVFKRATDLEDKESILAAINTTNIQTMYTKIDFTAPVGSKHHPVANVAFGSVIMAQWVKGKGKWPFDMEIVNNTFGPDIPTTAQMQPMQYS